MKLFGFGKKKSSATQSEQLNEQRNAIPIQLTRQELYGKAWLMIARESQKLDGLAIMRRLDAQGFSEATVVLAMFAYNQEEREQLVKKAADAGNVEGLWQYTCFLPHSFCPNMNNSNDKKWVDTVLEAAERGSVDAMNEMGNICNRWGHFTESMYWYAMANAHDHPDGQLSMSSLAKKWKSAGCPRTFEKGTAKFDEARFKCSLSYLEWHADKKPSVPLDEIIRYNMNGTPIAAYLAGDIFESDGNLEMAYKMYNVISFENDPHGLRCYADMLAAGRGVNQDMQSAFRFYKLAAELGEREAMFIMGEFLKETDKNMSAYWYGLSHTRGYQHALIRLAQMAQ